MMKMKRKESGFTLSELLIVVAIIAVLVAIAIPVFSSQLEKSREATDLANARAAYAEVMAAAITGAETLRTADGKYRAMVILKQKKPGWSMATDNLEVGGIKYSEWNEKDPVVGKSCTVTVDPVTQIVSIDWSGEGIVASGSTGNGSTGNGNAGGSGNTIAHQAWMDNAAQAYRITYTKATYAGANWEPYFTRQNGLGSSEVHYTPELGKVYVTGGNYYKLGDNNKWLRWNGEEWEEYRMGT